MLYILYYIVYIILYAQFPREGHNFRRRDPVYAANNVVANASMWM